MTDEHVAQHENLSAVLFCQESIIDQFYNYKLSIIEKARKKEHNEIDSKYNKLIKDLKSKIHEYNEQFSVYDTILSHSFGKNKEIFKEEELEKNKNLYYYLSNIKNCDELLVDIDKMNKIILHVKYQCKNIISSLFSQYDDYYKRNILEYNLKQYRQSDIFPGSELFFKIITHQGSLIAMHIHDKLISVIGIEFKFKFLNKHNQVISKMYHIFTEYVLKWQTTKMYTIALFDSNGSRRKFLTDPKNVSATDCQVILTHQHLIINDELLIIKLDLRTCECEIFEDLKIINPTEKYIVQYSWSSQY